MPEQETFPLLPSTCLTHHSPHGEFQGSHCITPRLVMSYYRAFAKLFKFRDTMITFLKFGHFKWF